LLYACQSPRDLLLKAELDALAAQHPSQFQVRYLVEEPLPPPVAAASATAAVASVSSPSSSSLSLPATADNAASSSNVAVGRVSAAAVAGFLPAPTSLDAALLVCGPPGMMRFLCGDGDAKRPPGQLPVLGGLLAQVGYGKSVRVIPFSDRNSE
jgi:NAD(P)H-flavin reductase